MLIYKSIKIRLYLSNFTKIMLKYLYYNLLFLNLKFEGISNYISYNTYIKIHIKITDFI